MFLPNRSRLLGDIQKLSSRKLAATLCHSALCVQTLALFDNSMYSATFSTDFVLSPLSEFDGGDCCECTCVSTEEFTCGENGGYACVDPSAACVDDDDATTLPSFGVSCVDFFIADGDCDDQNNFAECGASR